MRKATPQKIALTFIGGARRVTLAEQIRAIFADYGEVLFSSIEKDAGFYPISSLAQITAAPRFDGPAFLPALRTHLTNARANALACMDGAIPALAALRHENFGSGRIIAPSPEGARIALNKREMFAFFTKYELLCPRTFHKDDPLPEAVTFIAKPVEGFGGKGLHIFDAALFQDFATRLSATHVIQEFVQGPETTHDLYVFEDCSFISASRDRLAVVDGEVDHCRVRRSTVEETAIFKKIAATGFFQGPLAIQTIAQGKTIYLIEINARLGGGVTAAIRAGFPIIQSWAKESLGIDLPQKPFHPLEMKRARRDFYREL